jgi:hypothetical protein
LDDAMTTHSIPAPAAEAAWREYFETPPSPDKHERILRAAMDPRLGPDRLVVAGGLVDSAIALAIDRTAERDAARAMAADRAHQINGTGPYADRGPMAYPHEIARQICDWLDGRTGRDEDGYLSADDVCDAIAARFPAPPERTT